MDGVAAVAGGGRGRPHPALGILEDARGHTPERGPAGRLARRPARLLAHTQLKARPSSQVPPQAPRSSASQARSLRRGLGNPAHHTAPRTRWIRGCVRAARRRGVQSSRLRTVENDEVRVGRGLFQSPGGCGKVRRKGKPRVRLSSPLPPISTPDAAGPRRSLPSHALLVPRDVLASL